MKEVHKRIRRKHVSTISSYKQRDAYYDIYVPQVWIPGKERTIPEMKYNKKKYFILFCYVFIYFTIFKIISRLKL